MVGSSCPKSWIYNKKQSGQLFRRWSCRPEATGTKVAKPDAFRMTRAGRKKMCYVLVLLLLLWQIKFHSQIIFIGAASVLILFFR